VNSPLSNPWSLLPTQLLTKGCLWTPSNLTQVLRITRDESSLGTWPDSNEPCMLNVKYLCIVPLHEISVQLLSCVQLCTPWTAECQASLSITNSRSPPKPMSIESVMPSNHLILCHPLLPLSIFPSIRVFSSKSAFCIRWLKYWSFSFNISPSNEYSGLISFRMDWVDLCAVQGTLRDFSNTTVQKHQYFTA